MTIIEAIKSGYYYNFQMCYGKRRLVFKELARCWKITERKYFWSKERLVLYTNDEHEAVKELLKG